MKQTYRYRPAPGDETSRPAAHFQQRKPRLPPAPRRRTAGGARGPGCGGTPHGGTLPPRTAPLPAATVRGAPRRAPLLLIPKSGAGVSRSGGSCALGATGMRQTLQLRVVTAEFVLDSLGSFSYVHGAVLPHVSQSESGGKS